MTIQDLGSIGELLAAIATLATLIYLAASIRQNTKAIKASSHHAITDSFNQLNSVVGANPAVGRMLRLGSQDLEQLNEDETVSFSYLMLGYMRVFETLYYQWKNGTMDEELYLSEKRSLVSVFRYKGIVDWWRANTISFSDQFRSYIDSLITDIQRSPQ